jgi:CHAT domain-containing protein
MRLSWETQPRPDAIRRSLAALDAIERLRELQEDSAGSAALFSTWTLDYSWLSGRLLEGTGAEDRDLAFTITERMRARALLDTVMRPGRSAPVPQHLVDTRRRLLGDIAAVQRTLLSGTRGEGDRRASLEKHERLERQEREVAHRMALAAPGLRRPAPAFADVASVQATLTADEALLSFQIGLWSTYDGEFGGGSWLVALTRGGRSVYRLPDRAQLAPQVSAFVGLLGSDEELLSGAAVRLYDELLAEAMRDLPRGVKRLIVVPDGVLHDLPFDVLRASSHQPPLAAAYQLVVAPSATLWRHWRQQAAGPSTHRVLTLADPDLDSGAMRDAVDRNVVLVQGLQLGRLPYARRESRAIHRHLGSVESLIGPAASEGALKARDLQRYDIVHFATHAVADEMNPERSAVLLSAGAGPEDGLLQAREIADLDLGGRIVVLSGCRTVAGALLGGEGVLSLARAFFAAGAHAVIGSRWPIRDEDAAFFFEAFYRSLGAGASLAEALMQAKVESIAAGRPPDAWAGVTLLGDGSVRPFPRGRSNTSMAPVWQPAAIVASMVLASALLLRARRSRGTPPQR